MKKLVLLTAVFLIGLNFFSYAQLILPNGDFESWTHNAKWGYDEPTGGFFSTLNKLDTIPTPPGVTVFKCDTAHAGSYSAKCVTQKIEIMNILIPGVIGTIKINWATNAAILGLPYKWSVLPQRFQGYYQAYPLNGDSTGAILLLSKWNTSTKKRDTLAYNRLIFHGIISSWTKFDTAVVYRDNTVMPDSITLLLLSCGGYNASNMFGSVGQVGSVALFDDVTLTGLPPYGIAETHHNSIDLSLSPNPSSEYINIKLEQTYRDGVFEIYDTQGRRTGQFEMTGLTCHINVGNLVPGVYHYRFMSANEVLNSGSFIINR
jgi:hypothetical protein